MATIFQESIVAEDGLHVRAIVTENEGLYSVDVQEYHDGQWQSIDPQSDGDEPQPNKALAIANAKRWLNSY
ncbi:MAG: hypothetical protein FJZ89_12780 [Chloroflexi bacterium]|nr:hypothetical protein [Chloroflexota bacterium]